MGKWNEFGGKKISGWNVTSDRIWNETFWLIHVSFSTGMELLAAESRELSLGFKHTTHSMQTWASLAPTQSSVCLWAS